ncbi:MAG: hypothetical protein IJW36_01195 [Clostridia bacterium]|nr:hypothetical protein [Clostridia bacterium]
MNKSLSHFLFKNFYGKIDFGEYGEVLDALRCVTSFYNPETKIYDIDKNNKYLRDFIEKFFKMQENVEARYNEIRDYSNSLEGKARPIRQKLISRNTMRELERLYPKFDEFVSIVNQRLNISMKHIYYEIQDEQKNDDFIITEADLLGE